MPPNPRGTTENGPVAAGIGRSTTTLTDASDGDNDSTVIHGIAMSADDLLTMKMPDGTLNPARWTPDALKKLAKTLEGRPLTDEHTRDPRAVVGEVISAMYDAAAAVVRYKAELDDATLAEKIANGRLEVSPRVTHRSADELETEGGVLVVGPGDTGEFRHLMICQRTDRSTGRETRPALGPESSTAKPGSPDTDSPAATEAADVPNSPAVDASDTRRSPAVRAFEQRDGTNTVDTHDGRESGETTDTTDAADRTDPTTEAQELAHDAASARLILAAGRHDMHVADYVEHRYGLDAAAYADADTLRRDLADAEAGDDGSALTDAASWERP